MEDQGASVIINTNKTTCEYCSESILTMNAKRYYNSFKHKKNYRLTSRNNITYLIKEERLSHSSNYIKQKKDKQFSEVRGLMYCSCEIHLDGDTGYKRHVETLKHKNCTSVISGEVLKSCYRYESITCKATLSQYSVETHFKAKFHLDKVNYITEDITDDNKISKDNTLS